MEKFKITKKILFFLSVFLLTFLISKNIFAENSDSNKFTKQSIVGVSYNNVFYGNNDIGFLELSDQQLYEINNFPIVPFLEADINIGLTKKLPNMYVAVLFGLKKLLINHHNGFIFSLDLSSGIAVGPAYKGYENGLYGLIGKIGFNIGYKNILLKYGISTLTGFPFKGSGFAGLSYAF